MKPKKKVTGTLGKVLSRHNAVRKYLKNINASWGGKHTARNILNFSPVAIVDMLVWVATPEGHDFWRKINDEYLQELKIESVQICYKTNEPCKHNCSGLCKESY